MNNINGKFYIIKKKQLADAINFVTGLRYYVYEDEVNDGEKVYSFEINDKFLLAFEKLNELKNQLSQLQ